MRRKFSMFKDEKINNILRSNGKSKHPDDINLLEIFYSEYQTIPYLFNFFDYGVILDWDLITQKLNDNFKLEILFQEECKSLVYNIRYFKQQTIKLRDGLIIHLEGTIKNDTYPISSDNVDTTNIVTYNVLLSDDTLTKEEEDVLSIIFLESKIKEKNVVNIGMVSYDNGSYYVKEFDIKNNILDLNTDLFDLHYGEGFTEFNNNLIDRLLNSNKGLTLLHGESGTGKTTYLRYLIREIIKNDKLNNLLYFPPTMVDFITDPSFMNFISDWISQRKGKTYLLIEDAEPLLESRTSGRNLGITNLLNLTDGILNDILGVQILATFNIKIQSIDKSLLRSGRLLARKEFNSLSKEDSLKLAKYLEIEDETLINDKMSLSEIYSLKKNTKPLTHNTINKTNKISF